MSSGSLPSLSVITHTFYAYNNNINCINVFVMSYSLYGTVLSYKYFTRLHHAIIHWKINYCKQVLNFDSMHFKELGGKAQLLSIFTVGVNEAD